MKFQVNMLIEQEQENSKRRVERVLYIDSAGENLVLIDIFAPKALPMWKSMDEMYLALTSKIIRVLKGEPVARLHVAENTLADLYRIHRDKAWETIQDLVLDEVGNPRVAIFFRKSRGEMVAVCTKERGVTKQTVYKYLRKYWQAGQTKNALLPNYERCGGKGKERKTNGRKPGRPNALERATGHTMGVVIDDEIKKRFQRGVKLFYETPQKLPLTKAFQYMLETYFHIGYELQDGVPVPILPPAEELPTFRQFEYWYAKQRCQDPARVAKIRHGERRFQLSHRPVLGDSTRMAFGPGSIFQIDATIADIYLVSSLDPGRIIGRPVLYIITDVFSRMVPGFSVGLDGPGWLGAMLALENATTDKVAFCAEYGISIQPEDWPVHHLPKNILADRGELEGFNANHLVNALGVSVSNTPPYRADWKAIVERHFRLINDQAIRWVPGAVHPYRERGSKDYRLDACLNLFQFRSLLIRLFLFHNRFHYLKDYRRDEAMIRDHVEPYPLDMWNWGLQNRVGQLRTEDKDLIRLNLLPEAEAAVTEKGIVFRKRQYDCQMAHDEQWYVRARERGRWKIKVAFDPRKLDIIYLRFENGRRMEPCFLHDNESVFQDRDWHEILDLDELARQKEPARRTYQQQALATLDAHIGNVVDLAHEVAQAAKAGYSKRALLQGIRENRDRERIIEQDSKVWELASSSKETETADLNRGASEIQEKPQTGYIAPPRNLVLIQKLDKEIINHENSSDPQSDPRTD